MPQFKNNKFVRPAIFIVIALVICSGIALLVKNSQGTSAIATTSQDKPAAPTAKAFLNISKEFSFPIKDANGKVLSQIKYGVQSAALQDEILVKGERARAVEGRTFLILNLKITNTYKQGIQINSKDYVRLIVDGKKTELIAADIHNDPVEVQAISTKITRLGFPINENYKSLELQVGEISGAKSPIKLDFSK